MIDATSPQDAPKDLLNRIESLVEQQQIRKAVHPRLPLAIYNYTAAVQWRDEWDDTLMKCRGLVLDTDTGEIVACPMRKFFNYGDMKHDQSTMKMEDCDVMEKLDGSLGILFKYHDEWVFASRGSFFSSHAQWGMEMVKQKGLEGKCNGEWTYLFEMIYPTNRIVVDYGDRSELVLIAIVHTQSSHDFPLADVLAEGEKIGITLPRIHSGSDTYEALKSKNVKNEEGYIVRSRISGERVKVKFDEYVEIHAIRTRFSLRHIRQWFQDVDPLDYDPKLPLARLEHIPDEKFKVAGTEWDRLATMRKEAMIRLEDAIRACLEMEFRNVPNSPIKGWICKYLRLVRGTGDQDQKAEASLVPHQYAMVCIKDLPEVPEVIAIKGEEVEEAEGAEGAATAYG